MLPPEDPVRQPVGISTGRGRNSEGEDRSGFKDRLADVADRADSTMGTRTRRRRGFSGGK